MADYTADFEAGTLGNNVTTGAGEASATAWNAIIAAASVYDNAHVAVGSLSCKSSAQSQMSWNTISSTDHYGRLYIYLISNPVAGNQYVFCNANNNAAASIRIYEDGRLLLYDGASHFKLSTASIGLNNWVRVEYHFIHSTTDGQVIVKLFNTADSETPTETITSLTTWDTGTSCTELRFGWLSGTDTMANPVWIDDIVANATDWVGPAAPEVPFVSQVLSMQSHVFGHNMW